MANLAEAVDAAETDWLVSADIPDSVDYLTVESEVVQVTATFPAQYQARDGSTSDPRIRVVRAAGGTTAASHADGTTLTPLIPPSAAGGGAAALSLDNTIDPPADITSLVAVGATFAGSEATLRGKDFYAQDTDPGAVGTGSVWKDTGTVPEHWWRRNDTDDGWLAEFAPLVSGVGDESATATITATTEGAGNATAGGAATTTGAGNADARPTATSGGGLLGAAFTGGALSGPRATSDDGTADVSSVATTTGEGDVFAESRATAEDAGDATVQAVATAATGTAFAGSLATRGAANAGVFATIEPDGIPKLGFNAVAAAGGIAIPVLPASPTEQDIADVLVALGLATQTP